MYVSMIGLLKSCPATTLSRLRQMLLVLMTISLFLSGGCSSDSRDASSGGSIQKNEVDFPGMQMRKGKDKGSFTAVGRLRNRSKEIPLREAKLNFTMEDVLPSGASTVVAQTVVVMKYDVPAGESRNFEENVSFGKLPAPRGRHEWNFSITEINGKDVSQPLVTKQSTTGK